MKLISLLRRLSKFEIGLWLCSVIVIAISFLLPREKDILNLIASLIGVTALIFVAKGWVIGQAMTIMFALFYGIISYIFGYYGEMITYLFMSAPAAAVAVISWLRHPYKDEKVVEISSVTKKQVGIVFLLTCAVTLLFYFVLKYLGTASLFVSTLCKHSFGSDKLFCLLAHLLKESLLRPCLLHERRGAHSIMGHCLL